MTLTHTITVRTKCDACGYSHEDRNALHESELPKGWTKHTLDGRNIHICSQHKVVVLKVDDRVVGACELNK